MSCVTFASDFFGVGALAPVRHLYVIIGATCASPSTQRRRRSAGASRKHLVRHGHAARNPVSKVERPAINRDEGSTLAFSKTQARKMLDAPSEDIVAGLRDRAILSVGLQVGLRRAEIAALKVDDLHQNRGYDSLRVSHKGGRRDALAINPQAATRLRAYLPSEYRVNYRNGKDKTARAWPRHCTRRLNSAAAWRLKRQRRRGRRTEHAAGGGGLGA